MNRKLLWMGGVMFLLLGGAACFLSVWKSIQRVGTPGVKVVAVPVLGDKGQVVGTNGVALPTTLPGYRCEALPISDTVLGWLPLDTVYGSCKYSAPSNTFSAVMNVVLMGKDRTSIHKPEYCLQGVGWEIDPTTSGPATIQIPGAPGYELPVMRMYATGNFVLTPGRPAETVRGIYVFWFVADGQLTALHNQRMWWMARDLVTRGLLQRWAYVSCFTMCRPGQEEEKYRQVAELIAAAVPEFQLTKGKPSQLAQASAEP